MAETPTPENIARWSPPKQFRITDLYEIAPTGRAFLSQVLDFMTFGASVDDRAAIKSEEEFDSRLRPAKLMVLDAAKAGNIALEGVRDGDDTSWPQRIPRQVFNLPRLIDYNEIYLDTVKVLPDQMMVGADRVRAKPWVNVEVETPSLADWLVKLGAERGPDNLYFTDATDLVGRFGRKQLRLDNLRDGLISLREAQQTTIAEDGRPLVFAPGPRRRFDPMSLDRWSLPMAVAWIAYMEMSKVIEQMDAWCADARFAQRARSNDLRLYGPKEIERKDLADASRFRIVCLRQGSLMRMTVGNGNHGEGQAYMLARERLWQALSSGALEATGASAVTGARLPVPRAEWQDLDAHYDMEADAEYLASRVFAKPSDRYFQVTVRREDVLWQWKTGAEVSSEDATAIEARENKRPPHRPEEYLWNEFDPVVREKFEHEGDFDKRVDSEWFLAAAKREMMDWCEERVADGKWIKAPSPSAVRDRINKVRDEFLSNKTAGLGQ